MIAPMRPYKQIEEWLDSAERAGFHRGLQAQRTYDRASVVSAAILGLLFGLVLGLAVRL